MLPNTTVNTFEMSVYNEELTLHLLNDSPYVPDADGNPMPLKMTLDITAGHAWIDIDNGQRHREETPTGTRPTWALGTITQNAANDVMFKAAPSMHNLVHCDWTVPDLENVDYGDANISFGAITALTRAASIRHRMTVFTLDEMVTPERFAQAIDDVRMLGYFAHGNTASAQAEVKHELGFDKRDIITDLAERIDEVLATYPTKSPADRVVEATNTRSGDTAPVAWLSGAAAALAVA